MLGEKFTSLILFHWIYLFPYTSAVLANSSIWCGQFQMFKLRNFDGKKVSDFPLETYSPVVCADQCGMVCLKEGVRCKSYMYNSDTQTCTTFPLGYSQPANTVIPTTEDPASQLYLTCTENTTLGFPCTADSDCDFSNALCDGGGCQCPYGSSYNASTRSCVDRCDIYGELFASVSRHGISRNNNNVLTVPTTGGCIEACQGETTFTCVFAEYAPNTGDCQLCNRTWADFPTSKRLTSVNGWVMLYRHCQETD